MVYPCHFLVRADASVQRASQPATSPTPLVARLAEGVAAREESYGLGDEPACTANPCRWERFYEEERSPIDFF